ncbi:molybdopterin molybdotransferase MoeA [Metallosphaera javensis (ex Sakai et al. 2022)]|uniref:molybdopterin molybdotransferase MoeA n=1 Tax=Metallosphaera javensis (ex Sakai et al. 2022) TaxID=2775498 RepID=UPI002590185A|nr:MAG: molybdopterin molybdenumtransferase MoeA [Metallosphaera javensis (ex Sakai et al. 2022)]
MLIPIDEARSLIENMSVSPVRRARLDPMSAVGKVLAEDVIALRDTPERDISAMDGFAFRFSDLQEMKELRIVGKLFPSTRELPTLGRGEAYYITTGAPLPVGADTVARAEFTRVVGNTLTINGPVSRGKDVRQRGEDVKAGELLIPRGTYLTPYHLPILLQQRINEVEVLDISFCIFGNGDEIVPWGSEGDGIPDSIGPAFMKLLERFGRTHYQGIARDNLDDVKKMISKCAGGFDFVLSIGGSSVGERDFVKRAISEMGKLLFEGVSTNVIKRGAVGIVSGKPILVLPGQIVSAVTTFHEHGLHILTRMTGMELREYVKCRLGSEVTVDHKMDSTYLVKLDGDRAFPLRWGVGLYSELGKASGFTILRRGTTYREGEEIVVQRFL